MKTKEMTNEQLKNRKIMKKVIKYAVCILVAMIMLFPMYWLFTTSFKTATNVAKYPPQWWPNPWTLANYEELFMKRPFIKYLWNSVYIAALMTGGVIVFSALAGYAFAKIKFKGSNLMFLIILCGMMMPIEVTIIPIYTALSGLKLADSHIGLILCPMFGYCGAFGTFLMRQYFLTVPTELIEAGKIDGASQPLIFTKILLPMAISSISTLVIFSFLQSWNDYLLPLVLLSDSTKFTLPLGLSLLSNEDGMKWELVMAAATFSTVPILIVFYMCQQKFMESLSMSGLKG
ncbi:MAG: carbohydrate ABC transporter permease [Lachnospiraceae bacterium]|jgi:multiple sugar transport system permease protein|nr:carbohydrate ABC transporter permease [Lachnospiraceae bacterium]MCI9590393.1 carbohydrate ABC transporter permease [Lachnospiraceae bacterium]